MQPTTVLPAGLNSKPGAGYRPRSRAATHALPVIFPPGPDLDSLDHDRPGDEVLPAAPRLSMKIQMKPM